MQHLARTSVALGNHILVVHAADPSVVQWQAGQLVELLDAAVFCKVFLQVRRLIGLAATGASVPHAHGCYAIVSSYLVITHGATGVQEQSRHMCHELP
jgi:hypothetical protein